MISMKINNETVRMETYQPSSSTGMWHIDFCFIIHKKFLIKGPEGSRKLRLPDLKTIGT
jgi:hypothetical protein